MGKDFAMPTVLKIREHIVVCACAYVCICVCMQQALTLTLIYF